MRRISTSNGCRSFKSIDCGLRPSASETLLLAPLNFPLGEVQGSSVNWLELIFSMVAVIWLQSPIATGNAKCFARDPGRVGGREENGRASYVPGLPGAAQRCLRDHLLAHLTLLD